MGLNLLFETRETIRMRRAAVRDARVAQALGCRDGIASIPSLFCYNPLRSFIEVLNPDEDGYGEMCVTMLDQQAVIPLPRYTTGDMARLLSEEEARALAIQSGGAPPWLPMIAVKGRIKDQLAGLPSVEGVKECLYRDHAVADRLTGAFKILMDEGGPMRVVFQARPDAESDLAFLSNRLTVMLRERWQAPLQAEALAATAFPWRPLLDHERKFAYMDAPAG